MSWVEPTARASAVATICRIWVLIREVWLKKSSTTATDWDLRMPEVGFWAAASKVLQTLSRDAK